MQQGTNGTVEDPLVSLLPKALGSQDDEGVEAFSHRRREQRVGRQPPIEKGRTRRRREAGKANGSSTLNQTSRANTHSTSQVPSRLLVIEGTNVIVLQSMSLLSCRGP
jgi:hypothetical protein